MELSQKQAENVREAHHRWNVCEGAVRSGKSWLACNYTIPDRVIGLSGLQGIDLILGVSLGNIERNVLQPMRDTFGDELVGEIRGSENTAVLFGERVYCLGAEKRSQVAKLQGAAVKFCYCDELAALSADVFDMLKSRLSFQYSECHAACNPAGPRHWLKRFLDSDGDIYRQRYTIDDNPFLNPGFVESLKREYAGTVYYDRYINGLWTQAEGLVYPDWQKCLEPRYDGAAEREVVSVDYGTLNATAALRWVLDHDGVWHCVGCYYYSGRDTGRNRTDAEHADDVLRLAPKAERFIVDPSAASFIAELRGRGARVTTADNAVLDGIRMTMGAMRSGAIRVADDLEEVSEEFGGYVWDSRGEEDRPVKVADHAMDAMRYFVKTMRVYNREKPYTSVLDGRTYR